AVMRSPGRCGADALLQDPSANGEWRPRMGWRRFARRAIRHSPPAILYTGQHSGNRKMANRNALQLGRPTAIPASPGDAVLDRVSNPHADTNYVARFTFPEFTAMCPV